jgi:uncharacterized protein YuzE
MIRKANGYELSITGRGDGTLEAAYIHLSDGKVARTREVIEDVLLVDYDSKGNLVGIEILAPVRLANLTKLVDAPQRTSFRKFVKHSAPSELVAS